MRAVPGLLVMLAMAVPVDAQEQLYPGVYIQETTTHRVAVPRAAGPPYVLAVEIPRQTLRDRRLDVKLHLDRGRHVPATGTLLRRRAAVAPGDVLVGKITPKGETDPPTYNAARRTVVVPLAEPHGPDAWVEIVVPDDVVRAVGGGAWRGV